MHTRPPGPYPSWMNSSRAAHSDTSWGSLLLSTTKDRMGSRSSAPLVDRGTLAGQLQGPAELLKPQTTEPPAQPLEWSGACWLLSLNRQPRSSQAIPEWGLCATGPRKASWWRGRGSCNLTNLPHPGGQTDGGDDP